MLMKLLLTMLKNDSIYTSKFGDWHAANLVHDDHAATRREAAIAAAWRVVYNAATVAAGSTIVIGTIWDIVNLREDAQVACWAGICHIVHAAMGVLDAPHGRVILSFVWPHEP